MCLEDDTGKTILRNTRSFFVIMNSDRKKREMVNDRVKRENIR